jgi:ABC-type nitrate/sulfonate/bicarbonate transport system permease component
MDAERGLGALIITSQRRGPREHIYLVLLAIMTLAFLLDRFFVYLGRLCFPYRSDQR